VALGVLISVVSVMLIVIVFFVIVVIVVIINADISLTSTSLLGDATVQLGGSESVVDTLFDTLGCGHARYPANETPCAGAQL
jgi:hypothetical protein